MHLLIDGTCKGTSDFERQTSWDGFFTNTTGSSNTTGMSIDFLAASK